MFQILRWEWVWCVRTEGTGVAELRRELCMVRCRERAPWVWLASVQALEEAALDILHSLTVFLYSLTMWTFSSL